MAGGTSSGRDGLVSPQEVNTPSPPDGSLFGDTIWFTHDVSGLLDGGTNVLDALQQIAAQDQSVILPPAVNFYEEDDGSGNAVRFAAFDVWIIPVWWLINEDLNFDISPIAWKETGSTLGATELPFRNLRLGFNIGQLTTSTAAENSSGTRFSSANTTNNETYGARSSEMTNANTAQETGVAFSQYEIYRSDGTIAGNRQFAQEYAERTTEWFDRTTFGPVSWEISGGMIFNEATSTVSVKKILQAPYGLQGPLYRAMTMEATGAGGALLDFAPTATKVSLSIGANDWVMRFDDAIPASTAFGFVLDDASYGVLDENRI